MPFVNKSQMKACFAQNKPGWDCHKWAAETPNIKSLPEHGKTKKKKTGMSSGLGVKG